MNSIHLYELSYYLQNYLHIFYTQLWWTTRIAQVLPRLLAPVFATTSFHTLTYNVCMCTDFTITLTFFIPTDSIGRTFVYCLIFFTAANEAFSFPMWLILLSNQLRIISYIDTKLNPTRKNYKPIKIFILIIPGSITSTIITIEEIIKINLFNTL